MFLLHTSFSPNADCLGVWDTSVLRYQPLHAPPIVSTQTSNANELNEPSSKLHLREKPVGETPHSSSGVFGTAACALLLYCVYWELREQEHRLRFDEEKNLNIDV